MKLAEQKSVERSRMPLTNLPVSENELASHLHNNYLSHDDDDILDIGPDCTGCENSQDIVQLNVQGHLPLISDEELNLPRSTSVTLAQPEKDSKTTSPALTETSWQIAESVNSIKPHLFDCSEFFSDRGH